MNHETKHDDIQDGIAIVGMAARMPGAADLAAFWRNLRDGVESVSRFTEEELLASGLSLDLIRHPLFVPAKAIMDDVEMFDAAFFGITPREAELMDPQHRLMLECAWEVMEHAGYDPETYPGRVAVFTSAGMNTYLPFNIISNPGLFEQVGGFALSIYNDKDFVPTRIAYAMNLKGAAVDIGTACSSSLVSVHVACQHLVTYQADMALVGGVTVHLPQKVGHLYEEGIAYSPDGHCRPFDATRSGLIDGNGMAAVVLKRLEDALADGDRIYAVIKGTAINNDGATKVGYAAPSVQGQAEVIVEAQAMAGVSPESIGYIEAHGTATPLGDPIEVAALTQAFRAGTDRTGFCGLGSVKSNIGHVDKAAGLAGLIKTVLAMEHGQIPPSLHFEAPNPRLNLPETPFYVVDRLTPWPRDPNAPRRAGISSFGVGGTNAHAVIEEAPLPVAGSPSRPVQLMVVSAKTEAALATAAANLAGFLENQPDINLADACHTLGRGRRAFAQRLAFPCATVAEAVAALRAPRRGWTEWGAGSGVVFMFPGQGSQYPNMGLDLYRHEPVFREQVDLCAEYLRPELGLDIRELLFPASEAVESAAERLEQTALTQPALFVIEYALARLWLDWGVQPRAMIGHSIGEYVAACLAGVFELPDALKLVALRGRLMQSLPSGDMLAVPLAESALRPLLEPGIELAAVNAPELCVVAGAGPAVEAFAQRLAGRGLACRRLHTSHAFHSAMMEPILDAFAEQVGRVALSPPKIPYVSNLTGYWIAEAEATRPEYWVRHLRHTVRFAAGVSCLLEDGAALLLEVGPGRTLGNLAGQVAAGKAPCFASLPTAKEAHGAQAFLLQSVAELWSAGVDVDWAGFYRHERRLRVPLPTYPFQRRRYWIEPGKPGPVEAAPVSVAGRKVDIADWFYLPSWKAALAPRPSAEALASDWLVFADRRGVAEAVAGAWPSTNVVWVRPGAEFARRGDDAYTVNPERPGDFAGLFDSLGGSLPKRIAYFWPLDAGGEPEAEGLGSAVEHLLNLLQALGGLPDGTSLELAVVASRMRDIGGETALDPAQTALLGLLRAVPWEHPEWNCRAIDIPVPGAEPPAPGFVARLARELAATAGEPLVALRQGQRWVPDLEPARLDLPEAAETAAGLLREGGTYLITGGLDGIGWLLARQVAETVRAKLVLTTAQPLPENLDATPEHPVSGQVRELRALGAEVLAVALDRIDPESLESVLRRAESQYGRIDGIIHAADLSARRPFGPLRDDRPADLDRYWHDQRQAVAALETCLARREPQFLMAMSSLATETGGLGQFAHAAAGLYFDAHAQRHNRAGGYPWIVVDWDVWREEGETAGANPALADIAMRPAEGLDAFRRLLAWADAGRIVVATGDPRRRRADLLEQRPSPQAAASRVGGARHERPDLPTAYAPPRNDDEATMAALWQEFLGIERIGIHDNFFDLGGHSLLATQLVSRLRQSFGSGVELDLFFTAPSVAELTEALLRKQLEQGGEDRLAHWLDRLEAMSEEEALALLESGDLPPELLDRLSP